MAMKCCCCSAVARGAPLADHHGVPWAGLASVVLANKSPLADHHGARAGLASLLGKLANLYLPFSLLCAWHLTVSVGNSAVLPRFTAFRADLRCTSGFMMVILKVWQTLAFCDSPACSALLDYTWISATTSSTERGGHIDVWCFGLAGCCGFWWLCFVVVLVCVCFGFRTCSVSPLVLRPTRTAYCAADVVKRRRFKKKKTTPAPARASTCAAAERTA